MKDASHVTASVTLPQDQSPSCGESVPPVTVMVGDTRSQKLVKRIEANGWGRMCATATPKPFDGERWGFDNGAFSAYLAGEPFPVDTFMRRVHAAENLPLPYLAVLPDKVGAGMGSVKMSMRWLKSGELPDWPWYLAVQNGCCAQEVVRAITGKDSALQTPIDDFGIYRGLSCVAGLFLGGTDSFKATALTWRLVANKLGIRFHYGRAGTARKVRYALASKADSFDSAFPLWTIERFDAFEKCIVNGDPQHFMFKEAKP